MGSVLVVDSVERTETLRTLRSAWRTEIVRVVVLEVARGVI